MEVRLLKNEKDKLVIEVDDLTIAALVADYTAKQRGVEISTFMREHPYLANPKIVVKARDAKAAVKRAIESIKKDLEAIRKIAR